MHGISFLAPGFTVSAIKLDNCTNVKGFSVWTLLDNYEWIHGYTHKYGMYAVNFSDPNLPRTPKASAILYAQVCPEE